MRLSIIIPVYNESKWIARTVHHLFHFGGDLVKEIIVVDGQSEDNTVEMAQKAGAQVFISCLRGRAAQMDYGAKRALGDTLYFVHADTLPPETFAKDIAQALERGHLLGNFRYHFDGGPWLLKINAFCTRFHWFFTHGGDRTFYIKSEVYRSIGGYDPLDSIMEEYILLRKAKARGYTVRIIPKDCVVSARKYYRNSWPRVQLANLVVFVFWTTGWASGPTLKQWYRQWLH